VRGAAAFATGAKLASVPDVGFHKIHTGCGWCGNASAEDIRKACGVRRPSRPARGSRRVPDVGFQVCFIDAKEHGHDEIRKAREVVEQAVAYRGAGAAQCLRSVPQNPHAVRLVWNRPAACGRQAVDSGTKELERLSS
jgi:hypothetical protein